MRPLFLFLLAVCAGLLGGCVAPDDVRLEQNKETVRQFAELSNAADWDGLGEIVAVDFKRHSTASPGEPVRSLADFVALQKSFLESFPDQRVTIDSMIAEDDYVAVRATYSGTLTGPMGEFPATGKSVDSPFIAVFRLETGKIAELWVEWDNIAMLSQLGLFPPPE